jgi:hypothetical protein
MIATRGRERDRCQLQPSGVLETGILSVGESSVEKIVLVCLRACVRLWKADPADCSNTMDEIWQKSFFLSVEIRICFF